MRAQAGVSCRESLRASFHHISTVCHSLSVHALHLQTPGVGILKNLPVPVLCMYSLLIPTEWKPLPAGRMPWSWLPIGQSLQFLGYDLAVQPELLNWKCDIYIHRDFLVFLSTWDISTALKHWFVSWSSSEVLDKISKLVHFARLSYSITLMLTSAKCFEMFSGKMPCISLDWWLNQWEVGTSQSYLWYSGAINAPCVL